MCHEATKPVIICFSNNRKTTMVALQGVTIPKPVSEGATAMAQKTLPP